MRLLPLFAAVLLAGTPSLLTLAAAETVAAAVPAANASLLSRLQGLAGPVLTASQGNLELAKKSAMLPFAGAAAKTKVTEAQAQVDTANGLSSDLANLVGGKAASTTGLLAGLAGGTGGDMAKSFSSIPGAELLIQALSTPGVAQALLSVTPVDQVPGYATVKTALGL